MKALAVIGAAYLGFLALCLAVAIGFSLLLRRARLEQTRPISSRHPAGSKLPRQSTAPAIERECGHPIPALLSDRGPWRCTLPVGHRPSAVHEHPEGGLYVDHSVWDDIDAALAEVAQAADVELVGQADQLPTFTGTVTGKTFPRRCGVDGPCIHHDPLTCRRNPPCCGTCPTDPAPGGVE